MADQRIREPVVFGVAFCIASKIYSPFSGEQLDMQKADFTMVILVIDFFIIVISIFLINLFFTRFTYYAKLYDMKTVEMRDFTVSFDNKICDHLYQGKDMFYIASLYQHIETIVKTEFYKIPLEMQNEKKIA